MNRRGLTTFTHNQWLKSQYISEGQIGPGSGDTVVDAVAAIEFGPGLQIMQPGETDIINFESTFFQRNVIVNLAAGQLIITKPGLYGIITHIQIGSFPGLVGDVYLSLKINGIISRESVQTAASTAIMSTLELTSFENLLAGDIISISTTHSEPFPYALRVAQIDLAQLQVVV